MANLPRISIITPSFNQGAFIARTIDSVLAQNYPNLEHIVVDGLSGDETPAILARYPHLRILRERDRGQADAINKGMALATGQILAFLNSDDTYLPGALHRVARELDPARGRHLVTGRCIYIDEHDRPTGREHPAWFSGLTRLLQSWKGNTIPQPSTFWSAEAWKRCGPLDVNEQLVLDYDLMCRFARRYRFHVVDQVLATYRLHGSSKTVTMGEDAFDENTLRVSQRYWGPTLNPRRWWLQWTLWQHRRSEQNADRHQEKLIQAWKAAGEAANWLRQGDRVRWLYHNLRSFLQSPGTTLARSCASIYQPRDLAHPGRFSPETLALRSFTGVYADGSVGPNYVATLHVQPGQQTLVLQGISDVLGVPRQFTIDLLVDDQPLALRLPARGDGFELQISIDHLKPGPHRLAIHSSAFVIPGEWTGMDDYRPVSFRLVRLEAVEREARKSA